MRANTAHMDPLPEEKLDFVSQVREIQERYPRAHASLLNWAKWLRELHGIYPGLEVWRGWSMGKPIEGKEIEGSQGLKDEETAHRKRSEPLKDVKPDPLDDGAPSLERNAIELDTVLTMTPPAEFPSVWRKVIKAVYCFKRVPISEYQYPQEAGITNPADFLDTYEACLDWLTTMESLAHPTG